MCHLSDICLLVVINNKAAQNIFFFFLHLKNISTLSFNNRLYKSPLWRSFPLSASPLFHGSVASHRRARGGFSLSAHWSRLFNLSNISIHTAGAPFCPFQNNSLSSSFGKRFCLDGTNYLKLGEWLAAIGKRKARKRDQASGTTTTGEWGKIILKIRSRVNCAQRGWECGRIINHFCLFYCFYWCPVTS